MTGLETRETILGYIQRGGSPSPDDRILATRYGAQAAELIHNQQFGRMVSLQGNTITSVALSEVGGMIRLVNPDHHLIIEGKRMGVSFGEPII